MPSLLFADLTTLIQRRKPTSRPRARPTPAWFGPPEPACEPAPPGYGWFESSAELRAGLAVIEEPGSAADQGLATILATAWPSSITASA